MLRHLLLHRLFYVLPDEASAQRLVTDLETWGISHFHVHAIAGHGERLTSLLPATTLQRRDTVWTVEQAFWYGLIVLFALATVGLVLSLVASSKGWALTAVTTMVVSVTVGAAFALRLPHTHLDEFRSALSHREILLMVDVPRSRQAEIETLIEHCHPAAVAGGTGWTVEGLTI